MMLDQNATSALLFGVLLIVVALRPRPGRRRDKVRGTVPAFVGTGRSKDSLGAGRASTRLAFGTTTLSVARTRVATPVWMMATLTLLCGVGAASAVMATADGASYKTAVLANSPSVYWRLDEASGTTATDSSGNGNSGTYAGSGITYGTTGAMSGNNAITTSASAAAVSTTATILSSGNASRTIEAWFKTTTSGVVQGIIDLGPTSNRLEVLLNNSNQLWVLADGVTGGQTVTPPYSVGDGTYHYVAVTYDGTNYALYLDGQQIAVGTFSGALSTGSGVYVGGDPGGFPFAGSLDEAAVYPSALSSANITAHWQAGMSVTCPTVPTTGYAGAVAGDSPLRYWRFSESSGTAAADASGNCTPAVYDPTATHVAGALSGDNAVSRSSGTDAMVTGSAAGLAVGAHARSLEAWFKTNSAASQTVVSYGAYGNNFMLYLYGGQVWLYNGTEGSVSSQLAVDPRDGSWHHAVVTYDGATTGRIYLDGQQVGQGSFYAPLIDTAGYPVQVGQDPLGDTFTGSIDEVAVYSTQLTAAQVSTHWRVGMGATCPAVPTTGYAGAVHSDSPLRFYRLHDATSVAGDSSGNCRPGAYAPSIQHSVTGAVISEAGSAAVGTGLSAGVAMGSADALPVGANARSMEAWFNTSSSNNQAIVNYGPYGNDFALRIYGGQIYLYSGASYAVWTSLATDPRDGKWHHVVGTYDGVTTGKIYLDGNLVSSMGGFSGALTDVAGSPFQIGMGPYDAPLTGSIDDVAVYSTALSAAQVTSHFTAGAAVGGPLTAAQLASGMSYEMVCACAHGQSGNFPIDTATGNFWHSFTDISLAGRGTPLHFSRNYNAQAAATNGPFGYGWTTNYGTTALAVVGSTATLTDEAGSQATFTLSGGVWSPSAPRFIATLVHNVDLTWTLVRFNRDTLTFDSSGNLTAQADLNGYTTSYTYTAGELTTVTDQAGRTLAITWTGSNITKVTDANVTPNRVVTYQYNDTFGNLTDVIDVRGNTEHFVYDTSHRMTVMKDPKCQALGAGCPGIQNTTYDTSSRVTIQKDQLNRETDFDYTSIPGATKVTDPKGNVTVTYYNQGLRVAETRGYGTASAATSHFAYDPSTLAPIAVVDPNGHTTTMTVDASGNVLTSTDALGRQTVNTYNSFNEVLTTEDPNLVTTTYTYDTKGNRLTSSRPLVGGGTTQVIHYYYDDATHTGDLSRVVDGDSKTTTLTDDSYGNVASSSDPLADKTTFTYDHDSFLLTTVSPKGNVTGCGCAATYTTTNTNNTFGEVLTSKDPLTHVSTYTYDTDGNKATFKDANTNQTTYTYDVANELTKTTRPDTTTAVTDFNLDGTVLDQKDGKSNAILTYGYDSLARVTTVTDALSNVTTFAYDAAGNQLTQQDPGGNCATPTNCTTTAYDVANQATAVTYSDGVTPNVTNITYDSDGQRTGITDGTGSSAWVWDSLHRLTSYTNGNSSQVQYAYNLRNLPITITYPGTTGAITQGYDDAGRLTSVQDWLAHTTTFGYDVNSNMTPETLPAATGVVDTNTFDAANNLTTISDKKGGTTIFAATYGRDSVNQLSSDTSVPSAVSKYKYTTLNQLCYAGSASTTACASPPSGSYPYTFDGADNLTKTENTAHTASVTQQFNAADQLCWTVAGASANACASAPSGSTTYAYDTRGNRTGSLTGTAGVCDAFDQANRLTSIKKGTGSTCTTPTTVGTYAYNGDGLRMSKAVGANTTQNTWGMGLLLQEKVGSATATSYVYGPGGLPLEQITPTGTVYYYHHDQLGSTRAITDSAGAAKATYTYDPYGNVTACTGTTVTIGGSNKCTGTIVVTNPLTYSGQYRDDESGLLYLRARYYDPTTAQFMALDPMVAKTRSPYAYVAGNPLNGSDPSGLDSGCSWWDLPCQAAAQAAALLAAAEAKAKEAASSAADLREAAKQLYRHGVVSFGGCAGPCLYFNFQDGVVSSQVGGVGLMAKGPSFGWANLPPSQRRDTSAVIGGAYYVGAAGSLGVRSGPTEGSLELVQCDTQDWEVDATTGAGGYAGLMHTWGSAQLFPSL